MMPTLEMPPKSYRGKGRCIFCLTELPPEELTDEHIIPEALSGIGQMKILKGSCSDCNAEANSRYEQEALKLDFGPARAVIGLRRKRRGKGQKPRTELEVALGDWVTDPYRPAKLVNIPPEQYPDVFMLTMFRPAGILSGADRQELSEIRFGISQFDGRNSDLDVTTNETKSPWALALTIAKIAYTFAVAELGIEGFNGESIRDLLKDRRSDAFNFVGSLPIESKEHFTQRHLHKLYLRERNGWQTVIVHLFASFGHQPYEVVVGKMYK